MRPSLSKSEEELMNILWRMHQAPMRDLIEAYPDPKPAATTIATLLKRMRDKGYVDFKKNSSARLYFPLVDKEVYFSGQINTLIRDFFDDSAGQFASFFTKRTNLSKDELRALRKIIDAEINKK
ncbi:MAG: BlaI/MecI/CopY family transcriptional regulator [Saprospiraceae bacterium]|nr:BlaI/MecI/CopY family transcriptional regulator [Saprospiraceae bacterium]